MKMIFEKAAAAVYCANPNLDYTSPKFYAMTAATAYLMAGEKTAEFKALMKMAEAYPAAKPEAKKKMASIAAHIWRGGSFDGGVKTASLQVQSKPDLAMGGILLHTIKEASVDNKLMLAGMILSNGVNGDLWEPAWEKIASGGMEKDAFDPLTLGLLGTAGIGGLYGLARLARTGISTKGLAFPYVRSFTNRLKGMFDPTKDLEYAMRQMTTSPEGVVNPKGVDAAKSMIRGLRQRVGIPTDVNEVGDMLKDLAPEEQRSILLDLQRAHPDNPATKGWTNWAQSNPVDAGALGLAGLVGYKTVAGGGHEGHGRRGGKTVVVS